MAELARGLAGGLAAEDDVTVHSLPSTGGIEGPWREGPSIRGREWLDAATLAQADRGTKTSPGVDCWLMMNAGLVPLASRLGKPCFGYFHGNDFTNPWLACGPRWLESFRRPYVTGFRHARRRRRLKAHLPSIARVITNSHQTAELISRRLEVPSASVHVVHPGVDDSFFQPSEPAPEGGPLRVLTVTRLSSHTRRKNVDGVLRALASLKPRLELTYTVVGDGDDRPRLETLARELGLVNRVRFLGSVSHQELLRAYRTSDLFILASKATAHDVEGFGIVYLEASASGVSVLGSRAGGATDAISQGENGLLVEDSSPEAIAEGITRFADHRERFSPQRARAFAEGFRWPRISGQLRAVLIDHLNPDSPSGRAP
ncbi:MAG: glycosyltransferase family 4 protein [Acidobacteriota bacterium]